MDVLDGRIARARGMADARGAFLDSTLDRFADGSVFAGLAIWGALASERQGGLGDPLWAAGAALACLLLGSIVPYARARAEGLGMKASVGLAERTDRMAIALAATLAVGIGAPVAVLTIALSLVALASVVTVGQRMATVYVQSQQNPAPPGTPA
jgi:CDP-diacylglycerol--glycerol-3-phosphate 3-phosphatidyltransferase